MKWFGVDSDTPNDPKIRALLVQGGKKSNLHAQARMGGLFLVWCHIADHGALPGRGISADGQPLDLQQVADACYFDSIERLIDLLDFCATRKHIDPVVWTERREIFFPAMAKRADDYTKKVQRRAAKSGVHPDPVRTQSERAGQSPDSPVGTVGPVGVVVPPDDPLDQLGKRETRAREESQPLTLVSRQHVTHAACGPGGSCVPAFLHGQFCDRLQNATADADVELRAYYRQVFDGLKVGAVIGHPVKFWEQHFDAFVRMRFPDAVQTGPAPAARAARGASHTPAAADKYADVGVRDSDVE